MDHTGGMYMAMAIMLALVHRQRTGEGQWVDMSCTDAALSLTGTAVLDWTVNGRSSRRDGWPDSNRSAHAPWAPHGIYPAAGDDAWIAVVCRSDAEWEAAATRLGILDPRFATAAARLHHQDDLDAAMAGATRTHERFALARELQSLGVPAAAVARPGERIDEDPNTADWGLWPESEHSKLGRVRVDGLPVHLSRTDWHIGRGGPCLGEHTEAVLGRLLGMGADEVARLRAEGVL
jgi:crotonobetainyl-CoA:carnitine CoA-transferase CaiB-like acyl-CoA transferase